MIVQLYPDIARLAVRIRNTKSHNFLSSWRDVQLVIQPGQLGCSCPPNGSPWILTGCWPGKITGIDIANFRPDFPAIIIPAFERDADGRIVFALDERVHTLPPGRYTGLVRFLPHADKPFNLLPLPPEGTVELGGEVIIPPEYAAGARDCPIDFPSPPPPPPPPVCCVLATFDIDLGPDCRDHMIDQAASTFVLNVCNEEM